MQQKSIDFKTIFVLMAVTFACSSCGRNDRMRQYEETVIPPSFHSDGQMEMHEDPHAFMNMPQGMDNDQMGAQGDPHAFMDMPEGMRLPAGQDTPEMREALNASVARPSLSWETPNGWQEKTGSGMRLVTFHPSDGAQSFECSIVSLSGQAGGLESNVIRWMNQINITVPPEDRLNSFLARQEVITAKGGFSITAIDLTEFSKEEQSPSMITAIAELQDMVIFVKITGSKAAVLQNRESFLSLCRSLSLGQ
jgi:hypothetical protein